MRRRETTPTTHPPIHPSTLPPPHHPINVPLDLSLGGFNLGFAANLWIGIMGLHDWEPADGRPKILGEPSEANWLGEPSAPDWLAWCLEETE